MSNLITYFERFWDYGYCDYMLRQLISNKYANKSTISATELPWVTARQKCEVKFHSPLEKTCVRTIDIDQNILENVRKYISEFNGIPIIDEDEKELFLIKTLTTLVTKCALAIYLGPALYIPKKLLYYTDVLASYMDEINVTDWDSVKSVENGVIRADFPRPLTIGETTESDGWQCTMLNRDIYSFSRDNPSPESGPDPSLETKTIFKPKQYFILKKKLGTEFDIKGEREVPIVRLAKRIYEQSKFSIGPNNLGECDFGVIDFFFRIYQGTPPDDIKNKILAETLFHLYMGSMYNVKDIWNIQDDFIIPGTDKDLIGLIFKTLDKKKKVLGKLDLSKGVVSGDETCYSNSRGKINIYNFFDVPTRRIDSVDSAAIYFAVEASKLLTKEPMLLPQERDKFDKVELVYPLQLPLNIMSSRTFEKVETERRGSGASGLGRGDEKAIPQEIKFTNLDSEIFSVTQGDKNIIASFKKVKRFRTLNNVNELKVVQFLHYLSSKTEFEETKEFKETVKPNDKGLQRFWKNFYSVLRAEEKKPSAENFQTILLARLCFNLWKFGYKAFTNIWKINRFPMGRDNAKTFFATISRAMLLPDVYNQIDVSNGVEYLGMQFAIQDKKRVSLKYFLFESEIKQVAGGASPKQIDSLTEEAKTIVFRLTADKIHSVVVPISKIKDFVVGESKEVVGVLCTKLETNVFSFEKNTNAQIINTSRNDRNIYLSNLKEVPVVHLSKLLPMDQDGPDSSFDMGNKAVTLFCKNITRILGKVSNELVDSDLKLCKTYSRLFITAVFLKNLKSEDWVSQLKELWSLKFRKNNVEEFAKKVFDAIIPQNIKELKIAADIHFWAYNIEASIAKKKDPFTLQDFMKSEISQSTKNDADLTPFESIIDEIEGLLGS